MVDINRLLSNQNFGRTYRGSSQFRSLFGRFWNETVDPDIAEMRAKVSIKVNEAGKVIFTSDELNHSWTQKMGETPSELMNRIAFGESTELFDPTRGFGLNGLMTSQVISGPQSVGGRKELGDMAKRHNVDIHIRTIATSEENLERAKAVVGSGKKGEAMGLVITYEDKIRVVEMYEQGTLRKLSDTQTLATFQAFTGEDFDESLLSKRIKAMLNKPQGSASYAPGELNVHVMNTENMFDKDSIAYQRAKYFAEKEKVFDPTVDVAERIKKILATDVDGVNYTSETAHNRFMGKMKADIDAKQSELKSLSGKISEAEMRARLKEIALERKHLANIQERVDANMSFNYRAFGETTEGPMYIKGDRVVVKDKTFIDMHRRSLGPGIKISDEESLLTDILAGENKKDAGILRGRAGRVTIDPVGRVGGAYSDIISIANMGELYNTTMPGGSTMLEQSLRDTLDESMREIADGNISRLRAIAAQMKELNIDDFDDPQDYYDAVRNQDFIRRVEDFVDTGGSLKSSPEMTRETLRIIGEENFRQRRFGKKINFGGEAVADLKLRIPIPNAVKSHGDVVEVTRVNPYMSAAKATDTMISQSIIANPGMSIIVPDFSADNRFKFGSSEIGTILKSSSGGADFDDPFQVMYSYDPEAKRTLALLSRSPNALTEYSHMNVDLTLSKTHQTLFNQRNPTGVRIRGKQMNLAQLGMRKKELEMMIDKLDQSNVDFSQMSSADRRAYKLADREHNTINRTLDDFYKNNAGLNQTRMSRIYGMDKKTGMRRHYAPAGTRTTDESLSRFVSGSHFLGFSPTSGTEAQRFASRREELVLLRAHNNILPSEYVDSTYNERFHGKAARLYTDARTLPEYKAIESATEVLPLADRNRAVAQAHGLLGSSVNTSTVVDHFVESTIRTGTLSPKQVEQFMSLVESVGKITVIEREKVIDEIQKTGDPRYIKFITDTLDDNLNKLGRILGGMKGLGIDPAMIGQRLQADNTLAQIHAGYTKALGKATTIEEMLEAITLSPNDPGSNVGRLYQFVLDAEAGYKTDVEAMIRHSSQSLLDDIAGSGFQATDVESERARQFLKGFVDDQRAISGPLRDPEKIEQLLNLAMDESGPHLPGSDILGEFSEENLHRQSMNRLEGFGLLDDRVALDRQLVAIRQMAAERDLASEGMSLGRALSQVSERSPQASIHRLTAEAFNSQIYDAPARQAVLDFLEQTHRAPEFTPGGFIRYGIDNFLAENNLSLSTPEALSDLKSQVLATIEANKANMSDRAGREASDLSRQIGQRMGLGDDATAAQIHNNVRAGGSIRAAVNNDVNPGQIHHAMRSMSDEAAAEVLDPSIYQQVSKRLDQAELGKLLSRPGFRKGLGAAAIFAGLGLLHEVRGGRSQAEMEGPAFSPDSNNYSGGMPSAPLQMPQTRFNSVNRGTTFAIRGRGNFDPYALGSQMSTITGASLSGTIYEGSNLQGMSRPRSSSEALNLRMGN